MTLTVPVSPEPMEKCAGCGEWWDRLRLKRTGRTLEGKYCPRCRGLKWPEDFMEEIKP